MLAKKNPTIPDNTDRLFFEQAIAALKAKLEEYERLHSGADRKELEGKLHKQQDDQKDIFQYLNGELAKKTDEIVGLEERLLAAGWLRCGVHASRALRGMAVHPVHEDTMGSSLKLGDQADLTGRQERKCRQKRPKKENSLGRLERPLPLRERHCIRT